MGLVRRYPSYTRPFKGAPSVRTSDILNHYRLIMYFTLLFENLSEGPTEIYELVFLPSPVWYKGGQDYMNSLCTTPHLGPRYVMGDFRCLLDNTEIEGNRNVRIVCHDSGLGNEQDLNLLMSEMRLEGFSPQLMFRN